MRASLVCVAVLVAGSCGHGGGDPPACEDLATLVNKCDVGTTQQDWLDLCSLAVLTQQCRAAVAGVPCGEHVKAQPSYQAVCFPPCDGASTASTCNVDGTISQCVAALGGMVRYRCEGVCAAAGQHYTGTCGLEYQGRTAVSGQAVCWCE